MKAGGLKMCVDVLALCKAEDTKLARHVCNTIKGVLENGIYIYRERDIYIYRYRYM